MSTELTLIQFMYARIQQHQTHTRNIDDLIDIRIYTQSNTKI